jgi:cytochrome P450
MSFIAADRDLCLEDVVITAILIAVAGHETTANRLGAGLVRLLDEGDADSGRLADRIGRADSSVVSELLRLDAPVQATARTATHDHCIGGVHVRRGQQALVILAAANRDPAVFEEPSRFRLNRNAPASLTFGHGVHYCLGAALARMEVSAALRHILTRQPALVGPVTWRDTPAIRGPVSVPMVFG